MRLYRAWTPPTALALGRSSPSPWHLRALARLQVVAVEGILQLGLAQLTLTKARRLCQCSHLTITSSSTTRLPLQVDGEPFELEPIFAPRQPMSITIDHHNQAVMLSRSSVRADGVALESIDWAMQNNIISVEQRNTLVREVARRTGTLQRTALQSNKFGGSNLSLQSLAKSHEWRSND